MRSMYQGRRFIQLNLEKLKGVHDVALPVKWEFTRTVNSFLYTGMAKNGLYGVSVKHLACAGDASRCYSGNDNAIEKGGAICSPKPKIAIINEVI